MINNNVARDFFYFFARFSNMRIINALALRVTLLIVIHFIGVDFNMANKCHGRF